MNTYVVAVECALEYNGKFLIIKRPLGKHAGGLLAFPGGKIEVHDGNHADILQQAVKREIFEEVGLTLLDPIRYITSTYFVTQAGVPVILAIFHCKLEKTLCTVVACKEEVPEYYWMSREEIDQAEKAPPWLKKYVALVLV